MSVRIPSSRLRQRASRSATLRSAVLCLVVACALAVLPACDRKAAAPGGRDAGAAGATAGGSENGGTSAQDSHEGHNHGNGQAHGSGGEQGDGHDHGAGHADELVLTPEAIRGSGIRVAKATRQTLVSTITAPARVAYDAEQVAHIGSVLTGRVAELKVRVGDTVQKGDVLVVIDSTELGEAQSDYLQKRTAVETAKPAVDIAKSAYDRAKQLYEKSQGTTLTELQKRQGEYQAAQGALRSAEAALTAAENRLRLLGMPKEAVQALGKGDDIDPKYAVRAPIGGRVIEREVTLGELVGPEKERLMTIADLGTVWVLADVPEAKLGEISNASKVQITVPALGSQTFDGTVSYVSPELDPSTRTARVRVEVENPEAKLLPGMFARAEITAAATEDSAEPVVAVPQEAVQTVEGEPAIFVPVEGEPNTFAKRQVGIGRALGGMVPVFAGLKEGERYVAAGSFILKAELGKAGAAHEH